MTRPLLEPDRLDRIRDATEFDLCDHCLGRLAARVEHGYGNDERGRIIKEALGVETVPIEDCSVCQGLLANVDRYADLVVAAFDGLEFDTFLVGTRIDHDLATREEAFRDTYGGEETEPLSQELNRETGKRVEERLGVPAEFRTPDVTAVLDTRYDHIELSFAAVYVAGRYAKLSREIPQTRWACGSCRGIGCNRCDGTGKRYLTSVEERIAEPLKELFGASDYALHGAGREDVDARMLGTGRPFVLELKEPTRRHVDLDEALQAVNSNAPDEVAVDALTYVDKAIVPHVKESRGGKRYRAFVEFDDDVPVETLKNNLSILHGAQVAQRTPSRVSHRRADRVRKRRVKAIELETHDGDRASLLIRGDAGLYIKELVSGDEGRTDPSLAGLLGVGARVTALDVIEVEGPEGFDEDPRLPTPGGQDQWRNAPKVSVIAPEACSARRSGSGAGPQ